MIKKIVLILFATLTIFMLSGCNKEQKEYNVETEYTEECSTQFIEDMEAPIVNLNTKYVFSNDVANIDLTGFADIEEESSYTVQLCKFQKIDKEKTLDDAVIQEYIDKIADSKTETLLRRPENMPIRDGIYTAVYLVEDVYGNKTAKEVLVFYDTAAASVSGLEEINREIEVDDVNVEYTEDFLDKLTIVDAFDGVITKDMLIHTMERQNHTYTVKAEYIDRANNKTSIEYDITLKEKKKEIVVEPVVEVSEERESSTTEIESDITEEESNDVESEDTPDDSRVIPIPEEWNLIVVNRWNKIPEDYTVELAELSNGKMVDVRIYSALQEMFDAAAEEGLPLLVREGYRTAEEQQKTFDEKVQSYRNQGYLKIEAERMAREWVATPGTSEHELGLAIDINTDQSVAYNDEAYRWLAENAYEYGFILRYPEGKEDITGVEYEPWHYRYVGIEAALEIYERGICLEEYLQSR